MELLESRAVGLDPEDRAVAARPTRPRRAMERVVGPDHEPCIRRVAFACPVEIVESDEPRAVGFDLEDDTVPVGAAADRRSVQGTVGTHDEPCVGPGAIRVAELVQGGESRPVRLDLEDEPVTGPDPDVGGAVERTVRSEHEAGIRRAAAARRAELVQHREAGAVRLDAEHDAAVAALGDTDAPVASRSVERAVGSLNERRVRCPGAHLEPVKDLELGGELGPCRSSGEGEQRQAERPRPDVGAEPVLTASESSPRKDPVGRPRITPVRCVHARPPASFETTRERKPAVKDSHAPLVWLTWRASRSPRVPVSARVVGLSRKLAGRGPRVITQMGYVLAGRSGWLCMEPPGPCSGRRPYPSASGTPEERNACGSVPPASASRTRSRCGPLSPQGGPRSLSGPGQRRQTGGSA